MEASGLASDPGHGEALNPFATPAADRDPVRRARGRLVAPVTVVTAHGDGGPAGLTVSSIMVAEGEPALVYFLLSSTADLYDALVASRRFVVHVCTSAHRELADVFAGLRPAPGGAFAGRPVADGPYGPLLSGLTTRIHADVAALREESYSVLVSGRVALVDNGELGDPLAYFRGRYRDLA